MRRSSSFEVTLDPLMTYIVPVYNGEAFLQATLDSVAVQNGAFEIIIVDDGSTDSTPAIARSFVKQFAELGRMATLVSQKNSGEAEAVNVGLNLATGRYTCVLSADDLLDRDHLLWVERGAKRSPDLMVPDVAVIDEGGNVLSSASTFLSGDIRHRTIGLCECVPSVGSAFRTELAKKILRRPYSHISDFDFYLRFLGVFNGWDKVLRLSNVVCYWRSHGRNMSFQSLNAKRQNYESFVASIETMNFLSLREKRRLASAALFRAMLSCAVDGEKFLRFAAKSLAASPFHFFNLVAKYPMEVLALFFFRLKKFFSN